MIEQATVDCHNQSEEVCRWFTMIEENVAFPFQAVLLGVTVTVERINLTETEQIVAICSRGRYKQSVPMVDLVLATSLPDGAEWIEAFRQWIA